MGDNGRRQRAYPRIEGICPFCDRVFILHKNLKVPRHKCIIGYVSGAEAKYVYRHTSND